MNEPNSNSKPPLITSQVNEMVTVISDNMQTVTNMTGASQGNPQISQAPRVLPLLYIQKPTNVRMAPSNNMKNITSTTNPQMMLPVLKPAVVGKNSQFIPTLNPKIPVTTSSTSPSQSVKISTPNTPHFVIQTQRSNNTTTVPTNTITVPVTMTNPNIGKPTLAYLGTLFKQSKNVDQQIVLPANSLGPGLVPNPKLVLTSMPVLPKLAPAPTTLPPSVPTPKMTSVLVPMSLPTQSKPATINLKIANSQESIKTPISVLREPKPSVPAPTLPVQPPAPPPPVSLQSQASISVSVNSSAIPPLQPLTKQISPNHTPENLNSNLFKDTNTNIIATQIEEEHPMMNPEQELLNESKIVEEPKKENEESTNQENKTNDGCIPKNFEDDVEEEIIEEDEIEEEIEEEDIEMEEEDEDEVTLIKIDPKEENKSQAPVPEDDVKIEIVKTEPKPEKTNEIFSENFDPKKVLVWEDGIGALPGSNLKFRMNEFDMIEMVEVDSHSIHPLKSKLVSEKEIKKENSKSDEIFNEDKKDCNKRNSSEEFYCCESCGCYGLVAEFVNSRFCSHSCSSTYASKKAAQDKREQEMLQYKLKRKKKKRLNSFKSDEAPKEKQMKIELNEPELIDLNDSEEFVAENLDSAQNSNSIQDSAKSPTNSEDESVPIEILDSDNNKKLPWQMGKNGFSWNKYLDFCKGKAAPTKLFKDPFPYMKNLFKVGMKLEGIDPEHPSYFCVLTVCDVRGYRVQLHFDGYSNNHNFWVNADSMEIFPPGWCERNSRKLHPPRGYAPLPFNWSTYLKHCKAQAAPRNLFANKTASIICPNGFRVGMKLEAVDRKNTSLICVATVADLLFNRILVHFDNWDHVYDYWVDPTSSYIHPVGWCEKDGHNLTPPNNYKGIFTWENYLKETNSVAAPARAFKQRPPSGFKPGMRLECVDKRVPSLIRVATVDEVIDHQLKIKFDGWSDQYSYWIDDDSPDIHPMGWCKKTGYPLEPPLTSDISEIKSTCLTPGCKGIGHIKGAKYDNHQTQATCPYNLQNIYKERTIPDRVLKKFMENENEIKEEPKEKSCSKQEKNPVGRPPKWKRSESTDEKMSVDSEIKEEDDESEKKKKKRKLEEMIADKKNNVLEICNEIHEAIMHPGYDPNPYVRSPPLWRKHSSYLNSYVSSAFNSNPNPSSWSQEQVINFISEIPGCKEISVAFKDQQIDGEALLMLAQSDLVHILGLKLGPALKLYNSIVLLRQKAISIS